MHSSEQPSDRDEVQPPAWRGRFPYNEIISLLDVNRPFNLAESTSQDLTVGDLLDLAGTETLRSLKLSYGSSAGSTALREEISRSCGVPVEQIITTQGTALGLFLPPWRDGRVGGAIPAADRTRTGLSNSCARPSTRPLGPCRRVRQRPGHDPHELRCRYRSDLGPRVRQGAADSCILIEHAEWRPVRHPCGDHQASQPARRLRAPGEQGAGPRTGRREER